MLRINTGSSLEFKAFYAWTTHRLKLNSSTNKHKKITFLWKWLDGWELDWKWVKKHPMCKEKLWETSKKHFKYHFTRKSGPWEAKYEEMTGGSKLLHNTFSLNLTVVLLFHMKLLSSALYVLWLLK